MLNNTLDTTIGGGSVAVGLSLWLDYLQTGIGIFMLLGGAALLAIRLAIAWREWQQGHKAPRKPQDEQV